MHLIYSTILAWLNLLGWLLMFVILWGKGQAIFGSEDLALGVVIALGFWIFLCAVVAYRYTDRCVNLLCCRFDSRYVAELRHDLKGHDLKKRELALRILADHCGQPLGLPLLWRLGRWESWQWKSLRKLVSRRQATEMEVKQRTQPAPEKAPDAPAAERLPIFEPLTRGFAATVERLNDAVKDTMLDWTPDDADHAEPAEEPLPPLVPEQFVEALRSPVEVVLTFSAMTVNAAPHARAVLASRERCQAMLSTFLDGALELGLCMRVEAAAQAPPRLRSAADSCGNWRMAHAGAVALWSVA